MFVSERLKNENMTPILYTRYKENAFLSLIMLWELLRQSTRVLSQQKIHCCFHGSKIMVDKWFATFILLDCYISDRIMISFKYIHRCMHADCCAMSCTREPTIGRVSVVTKDRECCGPCHCLVSPLSDAILKVSRTPTLRNLFWSNLSIYTALDAHRLCSVVKF